jgi:hypothetical protein
MLLFFSVRMANKTKLQAVYEWLVALARTKFAKENKHAENPKYFPNTQNEK